MTEGSEIDKIKMGEAGWNPRDIIQKQGPYHCTKGSTTEICACNPANSMSE